MIDHISLRVQDLAKALDFYKAALAPLGYQVLMEFPGVVGLGAGGKADLWIMETDEPTNPTHIALGGERSHIRAFHEAAMTAGGTDNGPPGPRVDYHPNYYAAFMLDPEGNNIEVVCHDPEGTEKMSVPARKPPRSATAKPAPRSPARKVGKKVNKKVNKKENQKLAKPVAKKAAKPVAKVIKGSSKTAAKPSLASSKKPIKGASKKRR